MQSSAHEGSYFIQKNNGYLFDGNTSFIEYLYSEYLKDSSAISDEWRNVFQKINESEGIDHDAIQEKHIDFVSTLPGDSPRKSGNNKIVTTEIPMTSIPENDSNQEKLQAAVFRLIEAYRFYGHNLAKIDPLELYIPEKIPELDLSSYNLDDTLMDKTFLTSQYPDSPRYTLRKILELLGQSYCGPIGTEIMHIKNAAEKQWLEQRLENVPYANSLSSQSRSELLGRLIAAESLEKYLNSKYQGQKRFSLEGAESLIPLLDEIIRKSGDSPVQKIVIGMSHRGRLNVLVNIIGKSPETLFREFEGNALPENQQDSGDVKYHLGFTSNVVTPGGPVHISLASNPSHLEFINPVVEGAARSRQRRLNDKTGDKVLPVLIHGDAAFCSQGIVMETIQMTQTREFSTGGTLHIIVNNQIGFTKSMPINGSFTGYCTDIGKLGNAPIFHVNADNPEAVLFVAKTAFDFRHQFKKDVIIDLVSYRRHGHNETDEPRVTQPLMYRKIETHPTVTQIYAEQLIKENVIKKVDVLEMDKKYRNALDLQERVAPYFIADHNSRLADKWLPYLNANWTQEIKTIIPLSKIKELSAEICRIPDGFELHRTVKKIMDNRRKMSAGSIPIDWGFSENLAYASLLQDGFDVRISGQDSSRGTFFHRHSILHNQTDGKTYIPLQNMPHTKGNFYIIDSLLSEAAVLGFEYGYSIGSPDCLVIWEAQFGDFANGAQVIIDQFITSGETKWERHSGMTLFLPHGYDGQGPEHSSARLERFLNLAAENNIQICIPTLPSQMFHLLRRQMLRNLRKPLIVMTPKSLLRNSLSTSSIDDLANGHFENIIGEIDDIDAAAVNCLVVCSGKIYFELLKTRRERGITDLAIIRIEQLYPFPDEEFRTAMKKFTNVKIVRWCQEEPENQGAWNYIQKRIIENMEGRQKLEFVARPSSASPAVGNHKKHEQQQDTVIEAAINVDFENKVVKLSLMNAHGQ